MSYEAASEAADVAVYFDVLRASTTLTALLSVGASEIQTCASSELVMQHVARGYRLVSEVHDGGLDNSPSQVLSAALRGKPVVHKSTNLTQAIFRSPRSPVELIGCFANASALVAAIRASAPRTVDLIAAGHVATHEEAPEDSACARFIKELLLLRVGASGRVVPERTAIDHAINSRKHLKCESAPHYARDVEIALTIDGLPHVGRLRLVTQDLLCVEPWRSPC